MAIYEIISNKTAHVVNNTGFGDCCGLPPLVLRWPRSEYVLVECVCKVCPNAAGVLAHEVDIKAKWEEFRRESTQY